MIVRNILEVAISSSQVTRLELFFLQKLLSKTRPTEELGYKNALQSI